MEWIKTGKLNHNFYKFNINNHYTESEWAFKTAYLKTKNTIDTWQQRSPCKRFTNIFLGDLAKNLFKSFILFYRPHFMKFVVEYDIMRNDNFSQADEYDLRIINNNTFYNIEIKSSGEKYTHDINSLLNNRRIVVNVNNIHQHFEDFLIQVMFVPTDLNFFKNENFDCKDFELFCRKYLQNFYSQNITAYIVGYATRTMQQGAIKNLFNVENKNAGAKNRGYADLAIVNSLSMQTFLNELDKILLDHIANK